ncbi:DUF4625 domain-containing protein [Niabella sp.]|uniref:DUF4625 domain-containing protein n=1 Tax=Niabella sp. TaxID=1962976 RepID=UPI0026063C53|nr:DUF4625 domain-containing protein [Niabella sp.]
MNNKQVFSKWSIPVFLFILAISACSKDKEVVAGPAISQLELGSANSGTGYPGDDVHMEATIQAPGTIAAISVHIQPENGTGWTFDKTFTEGYTGSKNAAFHEHIDIPETAAPGGYRVQLTVTDKAGNTAKADSRLSIITDPSLPSVTGFEVAYNNATADLHIAGDITAPNKIADISLEIHGGTFEKEYAITGDYVGKPGFHLHKHFNLSDIPSGHFHVHLKIKDQAGKMREWEGHFDK